MNKKQIVEFAKKNQTALIVAAAVVVALVVAWLVWRKYRKSVGFNNDSDIENATGTTITTSIDFNHLAKRLWEATVSYRSLPWIVSWWPTGTNEEEVYAVLGVLNTQADYLKLEQAWINYYESHSWIIRNLSLQAEGTLPAILKSELTRSELAKARTILTGKGITPDF